MAAQEPASEPKPQDHPYTLHVYTNLIQIPSLVLTPLHGSYRGLKSSDFNLRLDSGPSFHPVFSRLEGDDPITLAFLLDRSSGTDTSLLHRLDRALERLPPDLLRPHDHVTLYSLDCSLVRSVFEPGNAESLSREVGRMLSQPTAQGRAADRARCRKPLLLWDALAATAMQLQDKSGRRVIVAITDGANAGGENRWERVRQYASDHSIAIFAIRPEPQASRVSLNPRIAPIEQIGSTAPELQMLCEGTGGLMLDGTAADPAAPVRRVFELLRARYILEFPRAAGSQPGLHRIDVSVPDRNAIIHTSGIAVPVEDKSLLHDPNTVPASGVPAPGSGNNGEPNTPP